MSVTLQHILIPFIPFSSSDIWNKFIQFDDNQYYHIKATSGSGKSSLIQSVYGLLKNYEGDIILNGKKLSTFTIDEQCHCRAKNMSIVFQDLKLFEHATAFDNIDIKRSQEKYYAEEKIHEFAKRLNITHTLNRTIETLSYGERQRIAIIRALMQSFETLLLDEPFSHLDEHNRSLAAELILQECKKRNACIIHTGLEDDNYFPYSLKLHL